MSLATRVIWFIMDILANTLMAIGVVGLLGFIFLGVFRFFEWGIYGK